MRQAERSGFKYSNFRFSKLRKYIGQVVRLRYCTTDVFVEDVLILDVAKDGNVYWQSKESKTIRYLPSGFIMRITPLPQIEQIIWKLENDR